jgi:hypothetical protein
LSPIASRQNQLAKLPEIDSLMVNITIKLSIFMIKHSKSDTQALEIEQLIINPSNPKSEFPNLKSFGRLIRPFKGFFRQR